MCGTVTLKLVSVTVRLVSTPKEFRPVRTPEATITELSAVWNSSKEGIGCGPVTGDGAEVLCGDLVGPTGVLVGGGTTGRTGAADSIRAGPGWMPRMVLALGVTTLPSLPPLADAADTAAAVMVGVVMPTTLGAAATATMMMALDRAPIMWEAKRGAC